MIQHTDDNVVPRRGRFARDSPRISRCVVFFVPLYFCTLYFVVLETDYVMGRIERSREIARRRTRRAKLQKLRVKFAKATDNDEKEAIQAKVRRLSPFASLELPAK